SLLNQLLANQMPPEIDRQIAATSAQITTALDAIRSALPAIDPTLAGAADTTRDRMIETLKQLQSKIVQAAKRKDDTLRRKFLRTQALAFPGGTLQERDLSVPFFISRHGRHLIDRLIEQLPRDARYHYLVLG